MFRLNWNPQNWSKKRARAKVITTNTVFTTSPPTLRYSTLRLSFRSRLVTYQNGWKLYVKSNMKLLPSLSMQIKMLMVGVLLPLEGGGNFILGIFTDPSQTVESIFGFRGYSFLMKRIQYRGRGFKNFSKFLYSWGSYVNNRSTPS